MAYPTDFCACRVNLTHLHWGRLVTYPYFTWLYIQQTVPHPLTHTYSGKGIIQVVYGPRNNHNVVNIEPKGQDCSSQPHTCKGNKEKWNKGTFSCRAAVQGKHNTRGRHHLGKVVEARISEVPLHKGHYLGDGSVTHELTASVQLPVRCSPTCCCWELPGMFNLQEKEPDQLILCNISPTGPRGRCTHSENVFWGT